MAIAPGPILLAFNKLDKLGSDTLQEAKNEYTLTLFIFAGDRIGLETLRQKLSLLVDFAGVGD